MSKIRRCIGAIFSSATGMRATLHDCVATWALWPRSLSLSISLSPLSLSLSTLSISLLSLSPSLSRPLSLSLYKMVHTNLPIYFNTLPLIRNQDIHGHNTRCRNKIGTIRTKHEFAKRCIRYSLAHTINSLPSCTQDKIFTHSLSGLSTYSKQFLFNKYESNCEIMNCYICS